MNKEKQDDAETEEESVERRKIINILSSKEFFHTFIYENTTLEHHINNLTFSIAKHN